MNQHNMKKKPIGSGYLSKFNPDKLHVEYREGVTYTEPINYRRYTLTHSDETADLFLTIGLRFASDKITSMRDEVLGEWMMMREGYVYNVYVEIGGHSDEAVLNRRNDIFRRELPLALEAIRCGDYRFFLAYPELNYCSIIVYFLSSNPKFNKVENWGTFSQYAKHV